MFSQACRILQSNQTSHPSSSSTGSTVTSGCGVVTTSLSVSERLARWKSLVIKVLLIVQTAAQQTKVTLLLGEAVYRKIFADNKHRLQNIDAKNDAEKGVPVGTTVAERGGP